MHRSERHVARDISYASAMSSKGGRVLVRTMENITGRLRLIQQARGYDREVAEGRDFWQVMIERYRLGLEVTKGSLDDIPATGPVVVVANHPYGILDGMMMGLILSERRGGDFRVLAHQVFRRSADLERVILPISFDETKEGARLNLETRAAAIRYLKEGGAIGIFPGGTVSTAHRGFDRPLDPMWRNFTAKMVAKSGATVVPLYFDGQNSRLFQLASRLHYTLRMGLLIREFRARVGSRVKVAIGAPISPQDLAPYASDPKAMMDFLRERTYALSERPDGTNRLGFEFEAKYRKR